uniref:Uncharacterized protein n=1 Tax=Timema bartmani TaxID=61472 RepID=A0A7R9EU50_9NEOP|nr:unnamed protein product [Timema bartmani]
MEPDIHIADQDSGQSSTTVNSSVSRHFLGRIPQRKPSPSYDTLSLSSLPQRSIQRMDIQAMQSMDWLFKKERIYLLAQFWQQFRVIQGCDGCSKYRVS